MGSVEAAELWRRVEERFNGLAREGLLSRDEAGYAEMSSVKKGRGFSANVL